MKQEWQHIAETLKHVRDGCGKGIDPGIFELVVALNGLGFQTTMSCEGHLESTRGLLLPWVDIGCIPATPLIEKRLQLHKALAPMESRINTLERGSVEWKLAYQDYQERKKPIEALREKANTLLYKEWAKLNNHLSLFYSKRPPRADSVLIVQNRTDGRLRLMSALPGDLLRTASFSTQEASLRLAQEEFFAFTSYLHHYVEIEQLQALS